MSHARARPCLHRQPWRQPPQRVAGLDGRRRDGNEAQKINGADPDFLRRDLADAIAAGAGPQWDLAVQLVAENDVKKLGVDVLDATKLWPEEVVPLQVVGTMTLDNNPDNFFAETEQVAFHPGHLVPGIDVTNAPLLQGRIFSYLDTQLNASTASTSRSCPSTAPTRRATPSSRTATCSPRRARATSITTPTRAATSPRCRPWRRADSSPTPSRSPARRCASAPPRSTTTTASQGQRRRAAHRPGGLQALQDGRRRRRCPGRGALCARRRAAPRRRRRRGCRRHRQGLHRRHRSAPPLGPLEHGGHPRLTWAGHTRCAPAHETPRHLDVRWRGRSAC